MAAFREGLAEAGLEEGENVSVEYRWADNDLARLPLLAAELERLGVRVLVGNSLAIEAAREAAPTLPLVFVTADDPVKSGYVESLNSRGGNITGVTFFAGGQLGAKRLELLKELMPGALGGSPFSSTRTTRVFRPNCRISRRPPVGSRSS